MVRADSILLVRQDPDEHGLFDQPAETTREVACTVRSASYRDIEAAGGQGLRPELIFRLPHDFEYQNEKICIYHGQRYNIDRVYFRDGEDWIDLTCSRGEAGAV